MLPGEIARHVLIPSVPAGGITTSLVFLVIAIVGTTIAPWQLFFQQSCVADKRLRFSDLKWARLNTFIGSCFTILVGGAMMIVGNVSFTHGLQFEDPAKMADAIRPFYTNDFVRNGIILMFCNAAVLGTTAISLF
jgi:Mn2+/Fe2+ NRAMP family transporter